MLDVLISPACPQGVAVKSVAVFCGSSMGTKEEYQVAARCLGEELAARGVTLVYGGGATGLMGKIADSVLGQGGRAIGIIPREVEAEETSHPGLTDLLYVDTMQERKEKLQTMADAFVVLPGGIGTLDEAFEILAKARMGLHKKPCGFLNAGQYFSGLFAFLDHMESEGFLKSKHRSMIYVATDPSVLLDQFGALSRNTIYLHP